MIKLTDGHTCRTYLVKKRVGRRWVCNACGAVYLCKISDTQDRYGRMNGTLYWLQTKSGKL
jgi:hypothetical protein